jgi:hypothetical protein
MPHAHSDMRTSGMLFGWPVPREILFVESRFNHGPNKQRISIQCRKQQHPRTERRCRLQASLNWPLSSPRKYDLANRPGNSTNAPRRMRGAYFGVRVRIRGSRFPGGGKGQFNGIDKLQQVGSWSARAREIEFIWVPSSSSSYRGA